MLSFKGSFPGFCNEGSKLRVLSELGVRVKQWDPNTLEESDAVYRNEIMHYAGTIRA